MNIAKPAKVVAKMIQQAQAARVAELPRIHQPRQPYGTPRPA